MDNTKVGLNFNPEVKYTLGIALISDNNPSSRHWVSIPLNLGFGGDDKDFTAE